MSLQGDLRDMAFADLVQHNCQERKTACLTVNNNSYEAVIYFKDGNVVHAVKGDDKGEEVVYQVLSWEIGTFTLDLGVEAPEYSIKRSWTGLLLEGARRIDEDNQEIELFKNRSNFQVKENDMNLKRLNRIVDDLKDDLGAALIATDIWNTNDAQSLAGFNTQPKATALFNEITRNLDKTLKGSDFPGLGKYYMLHLENNYMVIVVIQGVFQEGMLVDLSKTTMGVVMNVALPKVFEGLAEGTK